MHSLKLPVVQERVRLLEQRLEDITGQATLAQQYEEQVGDYVHQCEVTSDHYQYLCAKILEQYDAATSLVLIGRLLPQVAETHYQHLLDAAADESHNLALHAAAVNLEAYFDSVETELGKQICSLKRQLAALKAQYDDLVRLDSGSKSRSAPADRNNAPADRKRKHSPAPSTSRANFEAV